MATEVKVPAMGESISSGILAAWHVKSGDYVEEGQTIYELETDKITSEANAEVSGVITIEVEADEEVEIGQVVATIDESASAGPKSESDGESESGTSASDDSEDKEGGSGEDDNRSDSEEQPNKDGQELAASGGKKVDPEATLSPAARKAAEETGVDVSKLNGSGKDGRVTKDDILKAAEKADSSQKSGDRSQRTDDRGQKSESPAPAPSAPKSGERETRKKMSPLRKKIAEHLVNASQQSAMLTTFNEVDMSAVMKLRKTHQDAFVERHGIKLGFMSFFTKAVTHALKAVPEVNARIEGNEVVSQHYYDIGVAVGTDKGLMVPVVRECDQKDFAQIEKDIIGYAKAARDGKIQMSDLQGGVFTISNGGIYGSMLSTPIINFPQPAILGLHNIQQRAVVIDGEVVARPMMYLALSYDHRLIDGKEAVTFLVKIKEAIEDPARLLFGI
ncbi:dihydrolipoamide succinyltransferase [Coraliomargarita sinensis]|uniref:Dihydrolipoyllysine-residue succinyltransferase component of 2-oxoglutarate dehydrogenase complex n=1 Tax=Coraliomargarita sinensis TaxID=2174842 RepID=A0A317ZM37_9BACT|nr:2-oxoglutarate dehydrogenase complex dihydrolipoyllysine-residue succinyltransferase [Coraliomargarita sinensis]PXA04451.1 dihydrolipoamide succinyltransferase [Coraliomargarita sinensis]